MEMQDRLREYKKTLEDRRKRVILEGQEAIEESTVIYRYSQGYAAALKQVVDEVQGLIRESKGTNEPLEAEDVSEDP
jgi:oligoribonuclease NrnB/cAMP/cGMP phosphodiesterase (DHH superfamily)